MDIDESIVIREVQKRLNDRLSGARFTSQAELDARVNDVISDILDEIRDEPALVPDMLRAEIDHNLMVCKEKRESDMRTLLSAISTKFGERLQIFDKLVDYAEMITQRLEVLYRKRYQFLTAKDPRPDAERVTGAPLKCLLLFTLHSKITGIADEILYLVKGRFLDAADARLRTLHEHLVVVVLIANDHSYEISERYQDRAVFEEIARLRAHRRNFRDPLYGSDRNSQVAVTKQMSEAEIVADQARSRWGRGIEEQYGWARPALLAADRNKRNVHFTDLERASGAEWLRPDYLLGNNHIHAGAFATINHLNLGGSTILHPRLLSLSDEERLSGIAVRAINYLTWATNFICKEMSGETEEYDEFLVMPGMERIRKEARQQFG